MISILQFRNFITNANLNQGGGGGEGGGGGGGGENPPSDGWFSGTNTYYINSQATTLNEFGDGTWNGDLYSGGVLFTGTSGGVYYVNGNPATGVYSGTYYQSGVAATGTSGGVYYVSGSPANGVYSGTYYQSGVAATGTSGGVYYVSGSPANGVYGGYYYINGNLGTGPSGGVYYVSGSPAEGNYGGIVYANGIALPSSIELVSRNGLTLGDSGTLQVSAIFVNVVPPNSWYDMINYASQVNMGTFMYTGGIQVSVLTTTVQNGVYPGSGGQVDIRLMTGGSEEPVATLSKNIYVDGWDGVNYWLSGQNTTLDSNATGLWNGVRYNNGTPLTGQLYTGSEYVYFVDGLETYMHPSGTGYYNGNWYVDGVINNNVETPAFAYRNKFISDASYGNIAINTYVSIKNTNVNRTYRMLIDYNYYAYDPYGSPVLNTDQIITDPIYASEGQLVSVNVASLIVYSVQGVTLQYNNAGVWLNA